MLPKKAFIIVGFLTPIATYIVTIINYAYGGYDGKNCAGLLDAVWKCSEFEYYLDWLFNPFTLMALLSYLLFSGIVTPLLWCSYKKYNKQRQHRPAGWTR